LSDRAAIMFNPELAPVSVYKPSYETAARSLKVVPIAAPVHDDVEIERPLWPLGAIREVALSSCRMDSRTCITRR
jgi:hypothetical protein